MPSDVRRKPRSTADSGHWKASEWRNFLLFHSPFILLNLFDRKFYRHCSLEYFANAKSASSRQLQQYIQESTTQQQIDIFRYEWWNHGNTTTHLIDNDWDYKYDEANDIVWDKMEQLQSSKLQEIYEYEEVLATSYLLPIMRYVKRSTHGLRMTQIDKFIIFETSTTTHKLQL